MKIGVGISGGVDSAVTAALLQEEGHEVLGFTMLLMEGQDSAARKGAEVCQKLGIRHTVLDLREQFRCLVLDYFVSTYASGQTPSPCVRCNRMVKFGVLMDAVLEAGCDVMATGHYARLENTDGQIALLRGLDRAKDQSYFLAQLSQKQLSYARFPLGITEKSRTKEIGDRLGLVPKSTAESQDLCFLPNGGFADFVLKYRPELKCRGAILSPDGKRLGFHEGAFQYTLGQRRGLGLGGGPWFVTGTDLVRNEVHVGRQEDIVCRGVSLKGMNWLTERPETPMHVEAQLRYLMRPREALLTPTGPDTADLIFDFPAPLAPTGQLAASYLGDRVVASGWISATYPISK